MSTYRIERSNLLSYGFAGLAALSIAACGGGGGGTGTPTPPPATTTYTVGGTVAGLTASGLALTLNGGTATTVASGATTYTLTGSVNSGAAYTVAISTQPTGQTCTLANATGTATANVTNVTVTCSATTFAVSGTVSGLTGTGLKLTLNGANEQTVAASGTAFAFTPIASGTAYTVAVSAQPSGQTCTVANATGTISAAVTNVAVTCTTTGSFTVGGSVTNLLGSGLVLQRNAGGNLAISAGATSYAFPAAATGSVYAITILSQPTGPAQTCALSGTPAGTVGTANVTNINVTCTNNDTTAPTISGRTPRATTVGVNLVAPISVDFSEVLKASSVTAGTFTLTGPSGAVAGTRSITEGGTRAVFTPSAPLAFNTTYTATVTTGVQDPSGNALAASSTWTFNTGHKIAAGGYHTCARLAGADNGKVTCWGSNNWGQLGDGGTTVRIASDPTVLIDFGTGRTAVDIQAGETHTCARLDNGALKCWGRNNEGQLGLGDTTDRGGTSGQMGDALTAVNLGAGRFALEVAAGQLHTCARLDDASVKCWGFNDAGIIGQGTGNGTNPEYTSPQTVNFGAGITATAVTSFGYHTCAKLVGTNVDDWKCWGDNTYGQLGIGDNSPVGDNFRTVAAAPYTYWGTGRSATQVSAASAHTCAVLDNGTVKCYGNNWYAQIGTDTTHSPGSCSVAALQCVGDAPGELGDNRPPVTLNISGESVVQIASGDRQNCIRTNLGTVKCWGANGVGQLGYENIFTYGDDGDMPSLPAVNLGSSLTAKDLSAGAFHECALLSDDTVKCWGYNGPQSGVTSQGGQLGINLIITSNKGDFAGSMGNNLPVVDLTP